MTATRVLGVVALLAVSPLRPSPCSSCRPTRTRATRSGSCTCTSRQPGSPTCRSGDRAGRHRLPVAARPALRRGGAGRRRDRRHVHGLRHLGRHDVGPAGVGVFKQWEDPRLTTTALLLALYLGYLLIRRLTEDPYCRATRATATSWPPSTSRSSTSAWSGGAACTRAQPSARPTRSSTPRRRGCS